MGIGILEVRGAGPDTHVPGTALYSEDPNAVALASYEGIDLSTLKRAKNNPEIILVPQPSSHDMNDPLLWPTWKKHCFFFVLVYGTVLVGAVGPLVAADQSNIAKKVFHTSLTDMARVLSSYFVLTLGIATVFLQVASVKLGKRPIYLGTTVLLVVSTVWASYAKSLGSFAGARMVMAVSMAPLEFLVGASINDIYYVHERAVPVAIWNLALINGINITPPIAGQILNKSNLGFRWCFRFFAIAAGVLLLLQIFFMPETTFIRETVVPRQTEGSAYGSIEKTRDTQQSENVDGTIIPSRGYVSSLRPWSGINRTRNNVFVLLARPMIMLFTPIVFWGGALYGMAITFLVILAVSISVIFGSPPYSFSSASVGLTYFGPFIGAFLATLVAGPLTNYCARVMSRRNKGVFEPEMKLLPIALYMVFGIVGFVLYGYFLQQHMHFMVPVFFFGLSNFAIVLGATSSVSYIIDSHRHTAEAALGALIFWKNIYSFGLTWNLVSQILTYGTTKVFGMVGVAIAIACLLTIPMYVFGKRTRYWVHQHLHFNEENETSAVAH